MRTIYTILFSILLFNLSAQGVENEVKKLQELVDSENYMQALGLADKLIGDKVKEGLQSHASKVYLLRGITKYKLELQEDAIVDLKVSQSLDSRDPISYYYIADIYYHLSNYASSLENIVYFLEKQPENVEGMVLKSKCELEMGNPSAAKMSIKKALALKSSDPELYYVRAVINSQLGEDKLACKDVKIAAKFGFEDAKSRVESFCGEEEK